MRLIFVTLLLSVLGVLCALVGLTLYQDNDVERQSFFFPRQGAILNSYLHFACEDPFRGMSARENAEAALILYNRRDTEIEEAASTIPRITDADTLPEIERRIWQLNTLVGTEYAKLFEDILAEYGCTTELVDEVPQ